MDRSSFSRPEVQAQIWNSLRDSIIFLTFVLSEGRNTSLEGDGPMTAGPQGLGPRLAFPLNSGLPVQELHQRLLQQSSALESAQYSCPWGLQAIEC